MSIEVGTKEIYAYQSNAVCSMSGGFNVSGSG
jgi:hypothetical protein